MCKQNHMCAKVIQVRLFGTHPNGIAVFTPAHKICTKGENKLVFDSIKPNKTGFNSRLDKDYVGICSYRPESDSTSWKTVRTLFVV